QKSMGSSFDKIEQKWSSRNGKRKGPRSLALGRGAVAPGNACIQMIDFISSCVRFRVLAKLSIASLTHSSKDTSHLRTSDTPWTPEKTSGLRAVGGSLPSQRSFAEFRRRRRVSIIPTSVTPKCSFVLSVTGPIHT